MQPQIRVAILESHQSTVDGYCYRLHSVPGVTVVSSYLYAMDLKNDYINNRTDILITGIDVPVSSVNRNPFPILNLIDQLKSCCPDTRILVISYINQSQLTSLLLKKGINGFILKEDQKAILKLGQIVEIIAGGDFFFSKELHKELYTQNHHSLLTDRQFEVLTLCAAYPDDDTFTLSKQLKISSSTLRNILSSIYIKLQVRTRAAAILKARQLGLLPPASQSDIYPSSK